MTTNEFLCFGKAGLAHWIIKWEPFWIQVHDFWLTLGKTVDAPSAYLILLDLKQLCGGYEDSRIQDTICIETSPITGSATLYLQCGNRCDLMQLFQALKRGQTILQESISHRQLPCACSFAVQTKGNIFGRRRSMLTYTQRSRQITFTGTKLQDSVDVRKVSAMHGKLNDSSASTRLYIEAMEGGESTTREYDCLDVDNVKAAIACFVQSWREANGEPEAAESPAVHEVNTE
jgi:hypothetical protein